MKLIKLTKKLLLLSLILFSNISDVVGKEINAKVIALSCSGCHTDQGSSNKIVPQINSLTYFQFIEKMKAYKLKKDNNIMTRLTKVLSEEDILELAKFYFLEKDNEKK